MSPFSTDSTGPAEPTGPTGPTSSAASTAASLRRHAILADLNLPSVHGTSVQEPAAGSIPSTDDSSEKTV